MGLFAISRSIVALVPLTETVILGTVLAGISGMLYVLQDHSKSAERFLVFHGHSCHNPALSVSFYLLLSTVLDVAD